MGCGGAGLSLVTYVGGGVCVVPSSCHFSTRTSPFFACEVPEGQSAHVAL